MAAAIDQRQAEAAMAGAGRTAARRHMLALVWMTLQALVPASQAAPTPATPASATATPDLAADELRISQMRQEQQKLLAQFQREIAAIRDPDLRRRKELVLAALKKRAAQENNSRRIYLASCEGNSVEATYCLEVRRRIEEFGSSHFPSVNGRRLYGGLSANVTIDSSGKVVGTEVARSSGNRDLDGRALQIARAAGPFEHFPKSLKQQADQIVLSSRFNFTQVDSGGPASAATKTP